MPIALVLLPLLLAVAVETEDKAWCAAWDVQDCRPRDARLAARVPYILLCVP